MSNFNVIVSASSYCVLFAGLLSLGGLLFSDERQIGVDPEGRGGGKKQEEWEEGRLCII